VWMKEQRGIMSKLFMGKFCFFIKLV
jgi:hypothetical protein